LSLLEKDGSETSQKLKAEVRLLFLSPDEDKDRIDEADTQIEAAA
jgi:hypothetical protein